MSDCIVAMKSRTAAERAKRLTAQRREISVVSIDPSVTRGGCSVGLRLNCAEVPRLLRELERRGIEHGETIGAWAR